MSGTAVKRFIRSSIDWAAFAERVPPHEKAKFQLFKSKVDGYMKNVMSNPEKPPQIDFSIYRARLPNPAMVDEFEKKYTSMKIPYPEDKLTASIDAQEKQINEKIKEFVELSDLRCELHNKTLQWYKDMLPFEEMTMEDFFTYFPDSPCNVSKFPNFWPHDEPPRPIFPWKDRKAAEAKAAAAAAAQEAKAKEVAAH